MHIDTFTGYRSNHLPLTGNENPTNLSCAIKKGKQIKYPSMRDLSHGETLFVVNFW